MAILKLSDNLYISPQLTESEAQKAAELGIQTVICNRPDDEELNQPSKTQVAQWLANKGITEFKYQPVVAPAINANDIATFQELISKAKQPVLAYCRTGTRCALLWSYHQVQQGTSISEVLTATKQAGVDLSSFETRLQAIAK